MPNDYRALEGSERTARAGAKRVAAADPEEVLTVSVRLRRRPDGPPLPDLTALSQTPPSERKYLSREEFAKNYGASPTDVKAIEEFARAKGLKVVEASIPRRTVVLKGTVAQMNQAFQVDLGTYETQEEKYRGREGAISVPANIAPIVEGIFGLDNRKMAQPMNVRSAQKVTQGGPGQATVPLTPPQVAKLYEFPAPPEGFDQTIGILEFGGGYKLPDVQLFYKSIGLSTPSVTAISVDGQANAPGADNFTTETLLDIAVAGSAAPGAKLAVYFAPWTEQGWVDVVTTAITDSAHKPTVISVSYGWPESETIDGLTWSLAAIKAVNSTFQEAAALGVTVVVASGDSGSSCGISDRTAHVEYPGADPYVTCVGGTTISNVLGSTFTEHTWNDNSVTGGGISDIFYPPNFPLPPWQNLVTIPPSANDGHIARGIPDIAGNADPDSGYQLFQDGVNIGPVGGTSASAPLYAALVALLSANIGKPLGWLNPELYKVPYSTTFRDVNDDQSNATGGAPGYKAGSGWDACTGLGSVNGAALLQGLTAVPEGTVCQQTVQGIRKVITDNGPLFTVTQWAAIEKQLGKCVADGYLTQANATAVMSQYEEFLRDRDRPPPGPKF